MKNTAKSEDVKPYLVDTFSLEAGEQAIIDSALEILKARLFNDGPIFNSPQNTKNYLTLKFAALEHEVFGCLFLTAQHQLIVDEVMFTGTLTQTSVYPREVVKRALHHNAAAVMLFHNHPSGVPEPSQSDQLLTDAIKQALALVDVRVLDHFIVAGTKVLSFVERGMI